MAGEIRGTCARVLEVPRLERRGSDSAASAAFGPWVGRRVTRAAQDAAEVGGVLTGDGRCTPRNALRGWRDVVGRWFRAEVWWSKS